MPPNASESSAFWRPKVRETEPYQRLGNVGRGAKAPALREGLMCTAAGTPASPSDQSGDAADQRKTSANHRDACLHERRLHSIREVMRITGLGRTRLYEELADGLASVRIGRRRLVPASALDDWLASLPPAK